MIFLEKYYRWLLYKVCTERQEQEYEKVLRYLASSKFYSAIERDDNLLEHCQYMREGFVDEANDNGVQVEEPTGDISLLEVMVMLSIKAEDIMQTFDEVDDAKWFWAMMKNSGLSFYTNYRYHESGVQIHVKRILDRTYEANGKGGLFYIPGIEESYDLSEVELWYQLMWYINYVNERA